MEIRVTRRFLEEEKKARQFWRYAEIHVMQQVSEAKRSSRSLFFETKTEFLLTGSVFSGHYLYALRQGVLRASCGFKIFRYGLVIVI